MSSGIQRGLLFGREGQDLGTRRTCTIRDDEFKLHVYGITDWKLREADVVSDRRTEIDLITLKGEGRVSWVWKR